MKMIDIKIVFLQPASDENHYIEHVSKCTLSLDPL